MNGLDLVLLLFAVLAAVGGYRLGFLTRTISWIGTVAGLVLAARLLPWVVRQSEGGAPATVFLLAAGTLLGGAFIGQAVGVLVGARLQIRIPDAARPADRGLGAGAGVMGLVIAVWLLLPAMGDLPGLVADQTRSSLIARAIDRTLPDPPDAVLTLRRLVGEDQFPQVFDALQPAPSVGPPPAASGLAPETVAAVTGSTAKVQAFGCRGRVQEGSGFVTLAPDIAVTNAHVVSGSDQVEVIFEDGGRADAAVVAFDGGVDLAVLRLTGTSRRPLPIGDPQLGTTGAVFGHPGGAPLRVAPFEVGREITATGTDIYDRERVERDVLVIAASLQRGDSGGALVDPAGNVVGVAFAVAPDNSAVAYALDTTELVEILGRDLSRPVDTGTCLNR